MTEETEVPRILPAPFFDRIIRALTLQPSLFRDVVRDSRFATGQAAVVVCLVGLAQPLPVLSAVVLGWPLLMVTRVFLWFVITFSVIGLARLQGARQPFKRVLRGLGFADAPTIAFFLLHGLQHPWHAVVHVSIEVWLLAAATLALREVYSWSTRRAFATALAASLVRIAFRFWLWFQLLQIEHLVLYHGE